MQCYQVSGDVTSSSTFCQIPLSTGTGIVTNEATVTKYIDRDAIGMLNSCCRHLIVHWQLSLSEFDVLP